MRPHPASCFSSRDGISGPLNSVNWFDRCKPGSTICSARRSWGCHPGVGPLSIWLRIALISPPSSLRQLRPMREQWGPTVVTTDEAACLSVGGNLLAGRPISANAGKRRHLRYVVQKRGGSSPAPDPAR